jgi:hypothetical protein
VRLAISLIDNPWTALIALTSAHSCTPTTLRPPDSIT